MSKPYFHRLLLAQTYNIYRTKFYFVIQKLFFAFNNTFVYLQINCKRQSNNERILFFSLFAYRFFVYPKITHDLDNTFFLL